MQRRVMHHLLSTFTTTCLPADHSDKQDSTTTRPRRPVRESPPRGYRRVWLATLRSGTQGKDTGKLVEDRAGRTSRKTRDISPGRHPVNEGSRGKISWPLSTKEQYVAQRARGAYVASVCQPEASFDLSSAAQHTNPGKTTFKR